MEREPIKIEVWEPHPEKEGCLKWVKNNSVMAIRQELEARLDADDRRESEDECIEGVSLMYRYYLLDRKQLPTGLREQRAELNNKPWPRHTQVAIYVVTGTNEGWYVHIDVIECRGSPRNHIPMFLIKTFAGADHAHKVARRCFDYLGA